MRKNLWKLASLAATAVLTMGVMTGCGSAAPAATPDAGTTEAPATETTTTETKTEESTSAETTETPAAEVTDISGKITMAGSTSMEKISNAVAEVLMEKYPNLTITAEFTGSSAGVESLVSGSVDIGNASRALKDSEKEQGVAENIVAIDGIAVIVDKANAAAGLSKDQLISIYKGEVKNWSEVGGADQAIVVVGREAGSGTRGAFEEILKVEDACAYANELDSTGAVMAKVGSTPGAIGYVSLDVVDDTVVALSLDEVEPTEENIKSGTYFLSRPFVMATKGEISEQKPEVQAMFEFLKSAEGKELIKGVGLITVD